MYLFVPYISFNIIYRKQGTFLYKNCSVSLRLQKTLLTCIDLILGFWYSHKTENEDLMTEPVKKTKLVQLQEELDEDMKIDATKLQYESSRIPVIWSKWLRYYSTMKRDLLVHVNERDRLMKEKLDYYTGRSDTISNVLYERSEMKMVLAGDPAIINKNSAIEYISILIEFCSKALDIIKNKGYSIKNMIEIRQMESGS
ncbi:UvsY-like recombination mediator [Morganella phage vB_Mm5]